MKQTPIQIAISQLEAKIPTDQWNYDSVGGKGMEAAVAILRALLPAEQEVIEDAYKKGMADAVYSRPI